MKWFEIGAAIVVFSGAAGILGYAHWKTMQRIHQDQDDEES